MDFQEFSEKLEALTPQKKVDFIRINTDRLQEEEKVSLLLSVIEGEEASKIIRTAALRLLRQTSFQDFVPSPGYQKDRTPPIPKGFKKSIKDSKVKKKKIDYRHRYVFRTLEPIENRKKKLKIIKFIAKIKAPWVSKALLDALDYPCEEIRDFIIKELGKRKDLNLNMIYQKLAMSPWYVKSAVLKILGKLKNPFSIKHIEAVVKEPNVDVRRSAAQALGEIGGKESLPLLIRLVKDKNHYVKISAEEALRKVSNLKFC